MTKSVWQNRITRYGSEAPDQLAANPRNWRTHPKSQTDALAGVLREVGVVQNVIVNERTGYVVDGHARISLALRDGQASVPVTYVDLSEEEEALILSTLDPLSAMAGADAAQLDALLRDVSSGDPAVQQMLSALAEQHDIPGAVEAGAGGDEFDATPDNGPTRCQVGDLWLIDGGRHRLVIGDSTDPATVARLMDGERADAVVTDPPYSSGGFTRGDRTLSVDKKYSGKPKDGRPLFSGDNRDQRSWIGWCERWIAEWASQCRNGAAMAFWTDWRQLPATTDAAQGGGVVWRGIAVWDKTTSARPMYNRFRAQAEYLVWGSLGDMPLNKGGDAYPGVFSQSVDNGKDHITQKPINVIIWAISIVENQGLVLDPFLGSGTTIIAAHRTGRRCYGVEIEPRYGDVILRRCEAERLSVERADATS